MGGILVKKVDAANGKPLSDVEFLVRKTDGTLIGNAEGKPTLTDPGWTLGGSAVTPTNGNGWTVATQEVTNKKGIILPATGGIGTVIFYVVGSLLIGAAGVLFVTKRKKTEK